MTTSELVSRAAALAPKLEENARATDSDGVSGAQIEALRAAHLLAPADNATLMEVGRALAQGCGATAWLAVSFAEAAAALARLDAPAAKDVGAALIASASFSEGAHVEKLGAHFVVSGVWPSVGGLAHAEWILLGDLSFEGKPLQILVPAKDVMIEEIEYFGGLRGVKWRRVVVETISAPAHRVLHEAPAPSAVALLGALLGTAEGAYRDYVRGTRARVSGIGGKAVAQFTQVQARLAESQADMKALCALYEDVLRNSGDASEAAMVEAARDRAYIARRAVEATNRLLTQMGAMGLSETNPVQRRFRDLRAFASAPGFHWANQMAAFGRNELGIEAPGASDAA
jgi:alkylation response protein AidB-like acyl-CoA dehydrogenase